MSVAASNPSDMAAPSTFSYAQAAKGQGAAATNNNTPNPPPPGQDSQAPATAAKSTSSEAEQTSSTDPVSATEANEVRPVIPEKQDVESTQGSECETKSESVQDRRSESRRDEDVGRLDRPWRRNDKGTRSSSSATATTRSTEDQDTRKARRGKKGKASDKQAGEQTAEKEQEAQPEPPRVELSEAPIPTVNIWHQRKEAQLAKGKPDSSEAAVNGSAVPQDDTKPLNKATEDPTPAGARDAQSSNGVKPQRKATDPARPERNGPRGSRVADKEARDGKAEVPPPVRDAASWPTPETAIKETTKDEKRKATDRSDRSDKDSQEDASQPRSRQKWVAYDYVPTVSFETQIPQMRGSKPRGGARGGRESGTRATVVADKVASAAAATKVNGTNDRPREANGSNHAPSQPPAPKRASVDTSNGKEQKKPSVQAGSDKGKETNSQSTDNGQAPRDRPEGRGERGRAGYRGRGGHHVNSQTQHHQNSTGGPQGFAGLGSGAPRGGQGHYSPPSRQGGQGHMYMAPTPRGRGGRGASNYHRMSLPNNTTRMPAVQTQFPAYEFPVGPMSAIPYQPVPYWDAMLWQVLKGQIEYYFSIENLCKDMYLRQRMDSQGFVPLHFIAAFKRMRELTSDMALIRAVCEESVEIDYVVAEDDVDHLRRREDWQKFVLPMKDRDEGARNDGPGRVTFKNHGYSYAQQFNGIPPMGFAPAYTASPSDAFHHQFTPNATNEVVNGNGVSQLSPSVPDFAPSGAIPVGGFDARVVQTRPNAEAPLAEMRQPNGFTNGVHSNAAEE